MAYKYKENPNLMSALGESPQLKNHLLDLIEKEEKTMQEKMLHDMEKEERVKKIEDQFVRWAEDKNQKYYTQIEKAQKNKEQQIDKIVKKCKDRSKFVVKKYENQKQLYKKSMREAWKKAEKFNEEIMNYQQSKHHISKYQKTPQSNSVQISYPNQQKLQVKNHSMNYLKNVSMHNNSDFNIFRMTQFQQTPQSKEYQINEYAIKLTETIRRLKEKQQQQQALKVQQLGEKFEKIEKSRARRTQNLKKNLNKTTIQKDEPYYEPSHNKKKQQNKNKRVHSQTFYKPDPRTKDYSIDAKHKRDQMFEEHLASGNTYLQNLKIKHLKTVLAKNVAYQAIEKKLFLQRMHA